MNSATSLTWCVFGVDVNRMTSLAQHAFGVNGVTSQTWLAFGVNGMTFAVILTR